LKYLLYILISTAFLAPANAAAQSERAFGGHVKARAEGASYPVDSLFADVLGGHARDLGLELRLNAAFRNGNWRVAAAYQGIALNADSLRLANALPGLPLPAGSAIDDDRRWWDLTYTVGEPGDGKLVVHRLDRLNVSWSGARTVLRFGRQAISWGNGLLFNPVDVFNPFDPAAVDTEYKSGDDMLYGQYLFGNGDDLQGVVVVRRDPSRGDVASDRSSLALKYHGFLGMNEYDLLAAEHYGDAMFAAGGTLPLGGAVARGDLTWSQANGGVFSAVASLSYAWTWGGRNVSGALEVYRNGFGQPGDAYAADDLARNPELLARLARGELFTIGRNYAAASLTVEVTPLFRLTPNLFANLDDGSALAQIVVDYDLRQELRLLAALNLPIGADGSEYGGIETPLENRYLSTTASLFVQLAAYF